METAGYLDYAYFFHAIDGPGGFLAVQGWFCVRNRHDLELSAELRTGVINAPIMCREPRHDVAAANPAFAVHSGFNAVVQIAEEVTLDQVIVIQFRAGNMACGQLSGTIRHPEREIEQRTNMLSPLRMVKLRNLVLNERERLSHAEVTRSMPVTGQIDPAFACNLHCPLCLSEMARQQGYSLPIMRPEKLDHILDQYGDYLIRIWLSLWGEPLLNKQLPELIAKCKRKEIWVLISSNMSVPLTDGAIDAIVRSGLDSIILSIDGATPETYETYRRGGDLDLVFDNVRRLRAAREQAGLRTPYLYWRYLTFNWNLHEVEKARALATALGVDEFGIMAGVITPQTTHALATREPNAPKQVQSPARTAAWQRLAAERRGRRQWFGCDYLYQSISINSNGLVHPCCYVVSPEHAVGDANDGADALRNGQLMRASRQLLTSFAQNGSNTGKIGYEPCLSCDVVQSTSGHVLTQASFLPMYRHLMEGKPIRS